MVLNSRYSQAQGAHTNTNKIYATPISIATLFVDEREREICSKANTCAEKGNLATLLFSYYDAKGGSSENVY